MTATSERGEILSGSRAISTPLRFRLLGLLPLAFFTAHFIFYATAPFYADHRGVENMLWMCNVGNLVLAAGILFNKPWLIRIAVIWAIPGLPLWLLEVVRNGGWLVTSFLTHIGALIVGLVALHRVRADRRSWIYALIWYLIMQIVSRLFTATHIRDVTGGKGWNVNVAHHIYGGYENIVSEYWQFWLITTAMVAAGLWVLGFLLWKIFPPRQDTVPA